MYTPSRGAKTRSRIHPRIRTHNDRHSKVGSGSLANSLVATADRRAQLMRAIPFLNYAASVLTSRGAVIYGTALVPPSKPVLSFYALFGAEDGRCLSYRAFLSLSLSLTFLSRFAAPLRQNPVLHSALQLYLPSLHSSLSYKPSHGCTEPNHRTELSSPEGVRHAASSAVEAQLHETVTHLFACQEQCAGHHSMP